MRVWRICRQPHAGDALNGRGGLFASGRWHTRGRPVVYTSRSIALAALELLVHVDRRTVPGDLVRVEIDLPDELEILTVAVAELPADRQSYPAPPALQRLGDDWLAGEAAPVLRVPSSVIPQEANYLLNPQHPDARNATVVAVQEFAFDPPLRR